MKVAIIGTWHVHAKGYAKEVLNDSRCELVSVWDQDMKKAEEFAEEMGCKPYCDLDKMFAEEDFQGVVIACATTDHLNPILKSAKEKKHIFTEKVLTTKLSEALIIEQAIKESGVEFVISYPHKCNDALRVAKKMIDDNTLGKITYCRVRNAHSGSLDNWLPEHFYSKEQCGGGAMIDLGAHPMYTLLYLMGEPESVVSTFTNVTDREVEDNAVSVLKYPNGAIGVSETGFVSRYNNYVLEVSGTEGTVRVIDNKVEYATKSTQGNWTQSESLPKMASPLTQWIDAVLEGVSVTEFAVDEAIRLTKLMESAYKASQENIRASY